VTAVGPFRTRETVARHPDMLREPSCSDVPEKLFRKFPWAVRFRRLARDYERLSQTPASLHYLAFAILMLANLARQLAQS